VTQETDIERVVNETVGAFGGIDVVVNAAGIIATGTVETTTLEDWDYMMNLNVRAPFYMIQQALPFLIERKGNVVNVSSVTGIRAFPGVLSYCTSKAAVDQLTHCVALEVAGKGVRVNAVNPGVVVTHLHRSGGMDEDTYANFLDHSQTTHPLGRVGQAEEVADLIFFLASPKAGWITGVSCPIDGGRSQTCAR
jgi:NAD(P)-dependent dehydrogenase (short-subunit alcohol dehydrogenase family)